MDIFASLTLRRPPRYYSLYQRLLTRSAWSTESSLTHSVSIQMEALTGCPDNAMLAIAEISVLAHWKTMERLKGTLNYRELVRRGDEIEQRLRQSAGALILEDLPLHPDLLQPSDIDLPSEEVRKLVANVFREAASLYLYTVVHDSNPGKTVEFLVLHHSLTDGL